VLTLQLLPFILLGLVFFEQAGQHGRVGLGAGHTGSLPTTGDELHLPSAPAGRGHVATVSREAENLPLSDVGWLVKR
jgi:hypothetical protein